MYKVIVLSMAVVAAVSAIPQYGHQQGYGSQASSSHVQSSAPSYGGHQQGYGSQASSSHVQSSAPSYGGQQQSYGGHQEHYESVPTKYQFKYSVNDPHTHDVKSQEESGDGHYVKGVYSLQEPYGGQRTVQYSDDGHGFVAHVQTAHISHPQTQHGGYQQKGHQASYH